MKKGSHILGCVIALMLAVCQVPLNPSYAADFTNNVQDALTAQVVQVETQTKGMLPLRYAAEKCGYTVVWNEDRSILLQKNGHEMKIWIDDDTILLDGETIDLHYTPVIVGDKTYLPVEFYNSVMTGQYITQTGDNTYSLLNKSVINVDNMMDTVQEISQYPRHPSDETHETAMQYVIDKFAAYGYEVEKQEFEYDTIDFDAGERLTLQGTNLIAVKRPELNPTGDVLILGAHYDGVAGMPAANDNASGLSVLLELARVLRDLPSDTEIRFVAFDAEEDGLYGSQTYVECLTNTQNIIGMLNFDMLGGAKAGHVGIHTADGQSNSYLIDILRLNYEFCSVELENQSFGTSDYLYFPARLIQALDFSHPSIRGEYHNEDDRVDHIDPDMLEYAAKAGAAIAATIMSNITSSYLDQAKPKEPAEILEITPETYIPVSGTREEVERALGIPLTQIESQIKVLSSSLQYKIKVKLFDLDQPLDMIYSSLGANVMSPYIDLTNSGLTYEKVKDMLEEKLGSGTPIGQSLTGSMVGSTSLVDTAFGAETGCIYSSPYGNSFQLSYHEGDASRLTLSIRTYQDDSIEAYLIDNGELVRMDSTDLTKVYTITRTADGVLVVETVPQASYDLEVSARAQQCWDRLQSTLTMDELSEFTYLVLESDGYGREAISATDLSGGEVFVIILGNEDVEVPKEYQTLSESAQSVIRFLLAKGEEGDIKTASEVLSGRQLTVDYRDLLDEAGSAYIDADFVKALAVMKGTMLFDRQEQTDNTLEYPESGTPFEKITYNLKRDGQIYLFAEQFYQDIYSNERYNTYDLFSKYPNEFVTEKAAQSIGHDMAYSFAEFVMQDKPDGDSVVEQKIRFFYDFPELVKIREDLRQHLFSFRNTI